MKLPTNILCIYHKNCADGYGALTAVYHYCKASNIKLESHAAHYGDEPPNVEGKTVLIVDFSYPRETLEEMNNKAEFLHVIDHHKTAKKALKGLDYCTFNMEKSGAVLTWEFLFTSSIPLFIQYIQDRDLWQWELHQSKNISAGIQLLEHNLETWNSYIENPQKISELIETGTVILKYQKQQIEKITKSELPIANIDGHLVPCINTTTIISEIGDALSSQHPFVAMYFETNDKRIYSLRSAKNGIDVSAIAEKFGGGGHPNAASFSIDKPLITELSKDPTGV